MTNNTQLVSVPRELMERLAAYAPEGICGPTALQGFAFEAKRLLAAPAEDVRTVVEEPVAWRCGETVWTYKADAFRHALQFNLEVEPLYRHPQRPVVLPERKEIPVEYAYRKGWNACLDAVEELNK